MTEFNVGDHVEYVEGTARPIGSTGILKRLHRTDNNPKYNLWFVKDDNHKKVEWNCYEYRIRRIDDDADYERDIG